MRNSKKIIVGAAIAAMVQVGFSSSMLAATKTWDGGGANDNLSSALNWVGDVLPVATDDTVFTGLVRNTPVVDLATQYLSLTFDVNAGAFTFGGANALTLGAATPSGGNLVNNSVNTQTFSGPVNFYAGTVNAVTGALVFNGLVNIGNNQALAASNVTVNGAFNTTFNGGITGTGTSSTTAGSQGGQLLKAGTGTLFVNGASSAWQGKVFINGGAIRINHADALGSGGGAIETALTSGGTGLGALELEGNITVAKPVVTRARQGTTINEVSLRNISGNNTISSVTTGSGGSTFSYESVAGNLAITTWSTTGQTGARGLRLLGTGNGEIVNWNAPTGASDIMAVTKEGAGTWNLRTGMSVGQFGLTTVNGGNLVFNSGLGAKQVGSTVINSGGTVTVIASGGVDGELGNNITPTTITVKNGGTLDASTFSTYSLQAGQTLIAGGTIKAGSITAYGDNVLYLGDVSTSSPGTATVIGNLNLSSQFATSLGGIHFDLATTTTVGGGVNDLLSVQGAVNLDTSSGPISLRLHPTAGLANGTYRLIEFTSGATLSASDFTLTGFASGTTRQSVNVATAAGQVNLVVSGSPASVVWTGANSSAWDIGVTGTNNWLNGVTADKYYDFDSATFTDAATNKTVDLTTAITPTAITVNANGDYIFQGSGSLNGGTGITKSGSGKLTIANTGPNTITGAITINAGTIEVGNGGTDGSLGTGAVTNNGTLVFNKSNDVDPGAIAGTGALIKRGTGNIVLNEASTYSGATTIEAGVALASNAGAFGDAISGTTVADGATIFFVNPATTYAEPLNITGSGAAGSGVLHSGGSVVTTLTGAVTLSGAVSINNDGGSTLLIDNANGISGNGPITKFGSGALQIVGTGHSWTGGANVGDGTLILGGGAVLGEVPGQITVAAPGALAFGSTVASTYAHAITGNGTIAAGNTGAVTTLTGDLSGFTGTLATSTFGVASTLIVATPTNATVATVASPGSGEGYGILRLEQSNALVSGATINIQAQQLIGTGRLELANNITIDAAAINVNQRNVAGLTGAPPLLTVATASLLTPAISSAAGSNTLNGPIILTTGGSFAGIEAAAGATLTLGGSIKPLSTAASARQVVFQGAGTGIANSVISDDTQLINVYKAGTGTWTLNGANTYTGATYVLGGKLVVGVDAQAPILTNVGGVDIQGGKLSLKYTGDGSALANTVKSALTTGFSLAPRFSSGQIRSTTITADRVLGWIKTGTSVDVAYTLPGDTNLDFTVNFDDLLALAQNYDPAGSGKVWAQGDTNYSGVVNFDDLLALAQNYGGSVALANGLAADMGGTFASDWALALSIAPEPTTFGMLAGGLLLVRRRR